MRGDIPSGSQCSTVEQVLANKLIHLVTLPLELKWRSDFKHVTSPFELRENDEACDYLVSQIRSFLSQEEQNDLVILSGAHMRLLKHPDYLGALSVIPNLLEDHCSQPFDASEL